MQWFVELSLIDGWLRFVIALFGIGGAVVLSATSIRQYWRACLPVCAMISALLILVGYLAIEKWLRPFPDPLPLAVYFWFGIGVFGVLLAVVRFRFGGSFVQRSVIVVAVVAIAGHSAAAVNNQFAYFPTIGSALGIGGPMTLPLLSLPARQANPVSLKDWKDQDALSFHGVIVTANIPGLSSGFSARPSKIYVPPAYFAARRPLLPVLILLAGQPGSPQDWLRSGRLVQTMDSFAAQNRGIAPIVVVADGTGSTIGNPLCVDSALGNSASYLAHDVPQWIRFFLQVNTNPTAWGIGGLSYGGTCALQMATNYPEIYPTFLNISGQAEPTLGDRQRTLEAAFGGSARQFERVDPLTLLRTKKFPRSGGVFVVGADDHSNAKGLKVLYDAARDSGMAVSYTEIPGGHDFRVWSGGLSTQLSAIATRLGIDQ